MTFTWAFICVCSSKSHFTVTLKSIDRNGKISLSPLFHANVMGVGPEAYWKHVEDRNLS